MVVEENPQTVGVWPLTKLGEVLCLKRLCRVIIVCLLDVNPRNISCGYNTDLK